jgi:hypothetical protein
MLINLSTQRKFIALKQQGQQYVWNALVAQGTRRCHIKSPDVTTCSAPPDPFYQMEQDHFKC